ncbi:MAG: 3-isopropylmalate dehydrogenase [Gemmatimonadota bacterium]
MTEFRIAVLGGDGIGPEVTAAAEDVLTAVGERFGHRFRFHRLLIGATAVAAKGDPLPEATRHGVLDAQAVMLGAVGDPSLDHAPRNLRPETGLLTLRSLLGVYANLRPVGVHPVLAGCSPLRPERLVGTDLLIVRELTGGLYYGEPRGRTATDAVNTLRYTADEIRRVAVIALQAAQGRRKKVLSVDKANVLETSQLWRDVVTEEASNYPDVALEHIYVDYAAMRLISDPSSIDVLLTENMFGDILSDEAAVLAGSLGLLPSASLGDGPGLFEPIHGSAPSLAGKDLANPIGAIRSAAMLLRYGLALPELSEAIHRAVDAALDAGFRTRDIAAPNGRSVGTAAMTNAIIKEITAAAPDRTAGVRG